MGRYLIPVILALAGFAPAAADDAADRAHILYQAGLYAAAAAAGESSDTADGRATAARALAARAFLMKDARQSAGVAREARRAAEDALALDPAHVEARLQLAVSFWLEAREAPPIESYLRGLPQRGLALIEEAIAEDPDEAWGYALRGGWHIGVVRYGGSRGARMLGASVEQGVADFYRAMELAPDDAAIAVQCALAFLSLDPERYGEHARVALARARAARADDAFEAEMQARGAMLEDMLDRRDARDVAAVVDRWVGASGGSRE